jgi:hypothetical protein
VSPKHVHTFLCLPREEKALFFEALCSQYWSRVLLLVLPFRRIVKRYPNPETPGKMTDPKLLEDIRTATAQANVLAFWKNRCLVQSLAARRMLSRRGIASSLSFGVTLDDNKKVMAHAWIRAGNMEIVARGDGYTELFSY